MPWFIRFKLYIFFFFFYSFIMIIYYLIFLSISQFFLHYSNDERRHPLIVGGDVKKLPWKTDSLINH